MTQPSPSVPRSRRRRRLSRRRKALFALVTTGLLLGAGELAARWHYRGRWPYQLVFDPVRLWRHRPGWEGVDRGDVRVALNGLGLRERREVGPKTGPRLLVLGDSIAFGYALEQEQAIPQQLERSWRAAGRKIEVWNGGVNGYATEQETALLRELGPALEPDLVLVFFCMNNDVSVEPVADRLARAGAFNPGQMKMALRHELLRALCDRSALAFAAARRVYRFRRPRALAARAEAATGEGLRFSVLEDFLDLPAAVQGAEYARLGTRLDELRRTAEEHGARVALVLFPERRQVEGALSREPLERVAALGRAAGLPVLDLLETLRAAERPSLRERDGVHPNTFGAALVAERVRAFVEAERLLAR